MFKAFIQGAMEFRSGCGRTHPTNQDWNEAYDKGRDLAHRLSGRRYEG